MPSHAVEDYLKAIYELSDAEQPASTSAVAERLRVAAPSVSGMVKRLADRGLVEHVRYSGARLTAEGEREAVRLIRRHRVIELFLVEVLEYTWDQVHQEAERLEHACSDELVDRMAQVLGEPESDPHGDPIPAAGRAFVERDYPVLAELEGGERGVVRRVSDADPAALRYLAERDLVPGAAFEVEAREPFGGPLRLRVEGEARVIGRELARSLGVERLEAEPASGSSDSM